MRKFTFLKTILLLIAIVAGSGNVWSEETEILSWSRSGTTDSYTTGYTLSMNKTNAKSGYYQDSGTKNEDIISFTLYSTSDKLFSTTPSTITFHAKLGGGSTKDPLNYNVYVCFVDNTGAEIDGSAVVVTNKITSTNGSDFSVSMPVAKSSNAYGIKLYHMKEDGWNVRYFSFSLGYEAGTASKASAPEFSLVSGEYTYGTTFTLSSTNSKAIFYTTDGTTPTISSTEYSTPISITSEMTVKAFAIDNADEATAIITRSYSVKTPDAPTFSTEAGRVAEGTTVTVSVEDGCVISYTTDGTDPLTSGTAKLTDGQTATMTINATMTIRAIAIDGGGNNSEEVSAKYVVVDADAMTETKSSFDATSGTLEHDITFASNKGGAGTAPGNYNSGIRLYQISGSNKYGGYITLTAPTGMKIHGFTVTSTNTYATTVNYTVGDYNDDFDGENYSLAKSSSYSVDGLNCSSVNIYNVGTTSSGRLEIAAISVIYTGESSITLNADCHDANGNIYGTFSDAHHAFYVPEGLTVSEVNVSGGKLAVTNYATGAIVPKNTGVLVSATSAGAKTIQLTGKTGSALGTNLLRPTGDEGIGFGQMSDETGCKFYRLTMHNGTDLGFWWGKAEGAAFDYYTPNRAYLAVPNTAAAKGGFLLFDETTGIESLPQATNQKGDTEWYNLAGQRVAQPTRGLYIVGGKKVNVK